MCSISKGYLPLIRRVSQIHLNASFPQRSYSPQFVFPTLFTLHSSLRKSAQAQSPIKPIDRSLVRWATTFLGYKVKMKPSTLIQSVFVALPALVSAVGTLGFALGTKKPDGSCKYQADYEADYDAIRAASGSSIIRGYSASDCNFAEYALPAAKTRGFQVILGIW